MIIASERHQKTSEWSRVVPVYNAASTRIASADQIDELTSGELSDHLFDKAIGLPWVFYTSSDFIAAILRFFLQILPALIVDGLLVLFKRKPMVMKIQRIFFYSENAVRHFANNEFVFDNSKFKDLALNLSKDDKEDFHLDARVPMMEYLKKSYIVTKEVILNETAESAARARKKVPYWRALGWMIKLFVVYIAYKLSIFFMNLLKIYFELKE